MSWCACGLFKCDRAASLNGSIGIPLRETLGVSGIDHGRKGDLSLLQAAGQVRYTSESSEPTDRDREH